jgi:Ca-activated chloride channel family protein
VADNAGLATHWARAKIAALLDARRGGAEDEAIRHAVLDVALTHHLVSPYTSLVAVDITPARPEGAGLSSHPMPTNLPHGWDYTEVFGLGQGATDAPMHLLLGGVALLSAAALLLARRRRAVAMLVGLRRGGA